MRAPHFPRAVLRLLCATLCLVLAAPAAAEVRAYWSFDEGSGAVVHDQSGNGKHAQVQGATWVPGYRGGAMQFLPNGQIAHSIPASFDDTVTDQFSIHVWLRWAGDHPQTYSPLSYVLDARTCSPCNRGFILMLLRGGQVALDIDSPTWMRFLASTPIPADTWTHLAVVFDATQDSVWFYVNGVRDVAHHAPTSYVQTTLSPAIGNNRWSTGDGQYAPFNGVIDELVFLDHAMTAGEAHDAQFGPPPALYTLSVTSRGHGAVSVVPDQPSYAAGSPVTLQPEPEPEHYFAFWGGDTSGTDDPLAFTMMRDRDIVAEFSKALTLTWTTGGHVVALPDQVAQDPGSTVQITAVADDGWRFLGWDGDAAGIANPASVTMDRDRAVHARFCVEPGIAIELVGEGTVARTPDLDCYSPGSAVMLTAIPATGWRFDHWEGDLSGNANPAMLSTLTDRNVTAVFVIRTFTLDVDVVGDGVVARDPELPEYAYGSVVTLMPVAAMGWCFERWSGDASERLDPLELLIDADKHVTATFLNAALDTLHCYVYSDVNFFAPAVSLWPTVSMWQRALHVQVADRCGNGLAGVPVELSFAACPQVALCLGTEVGPCVSPPERYRVCATSDGSGAASFTLFGGGTSPGGRAEVRVGGHVIARPPVVSPDQDGNLVVNSTDLDTLMARMMADPYDPRVDLDGAGGGGPTDVSILIGAFGRQCTSPVGAEPAVEGSRGYALSPARPNPSAGAPELGFTLPVAATVRLRVLDAAGRLVRAAHDGTLLPAGTHRWRWDGRNEAGALVRPGVYFVTLASKLGTRTGIIVLVR